MRCKQKCSHHACLQLKAPWYVVSSGNLGSTSEEWLPQYKSKVSLLHARCCPPFVTYLPQQVRRPPLLPTACLLILGCTQDIVE